jgi:heptosyltransferase-3
MTKAIQNILLVRTDRIGDVILTTPTIKILKQEFPASKIYFLTRRYVELLLKHNNLLEKTLLYEPDNLHKGIIGHIRLAKDLKSYQFDLAFLFYPRSLLAFSLFWAGIPIRVGIGYRWYSLFFNQRVYEHRKHGKRHELEYNISLMQNFITRIPEPAEITFDYSFNTELIKIQQKEKNKQILNDHYIIVHPGSGGSAPVLPPNKFVDIIKYLLNNTSLDILLIGNKQEKDLIDTIYKQIKHKRVRPIIGSWDLETYMAMIAGCQLFIGNSTGPLHIARAFNIPLIGFYCPAIPCSPKRWGPYNKLDSVIMPDITPCKTCNLKKCPYDNCLSMIEWKDIKIKLDKEIEAIVSSL